MFRVGPAEIPAATVPVDKSEQMYRTRAHQWFQDSLRGIDSELYLAFDRAICRWVILRDRYILRTLDTEKRFGFPLTYRHIMPAVVHDICWVTEETRRNGSKSVFHYRVPDQATLDHIGRMTKFEPGALDWDNSAWVARRMEEIGEAAWERGEKRHRDMVTGHMQDMASRVDQNASTPCWKPMVTVPKDIPKAEATP